MTCSTSSVRPLALSFSLLAVLACSACTGDPMTTPRTPFDPRLDPVRTVASLSDEEVADYCAASEAYHRSEIADDDLRRMPCIVSAVLGSPDRETCESAVAACMPEPVETTFHCAVAGVRDGCSLTVDDANRCVEDFGASLLGVLEPSVACDYMDGRLLDIGELAPACGELYEQCPALE